MARRVRWFSCGAASAVATMLDIADHGHDGNVIAYTDTGSEDDDNPRFMKDCEAWFGAPVVVLKSTRYANVDEVIEKRRFLNGPEGALCSFELKRRLRMEFQRDDDAQVFGYTADPKDVERADRFRENHPEVDIVTPLIEHGLTKGNVLAMVERAGIKLPNQYLRGYRNNNCIGCVKGGMGYWNKVRIDRPDVFARRAAQEREIDHSCIHDENGMVFLDELDPTRGRYEAEDVDCGLFCLPIEATIGGES